MLSGILIAITGILIVLTARSVTTLFHELGHAIPALLFTRQPVVVHVGSYGDIRHSLRLPLGRLTLYLKFNFLDWKLGLCQHEGDISYLQLFIIILGGPLISLLIAGAMLYGLFQDTIEDTIRVGMGLFLLSSTWDFLANIVPVSRPLKLHDGGQAYNDGYQLMRLLRLGAHSADFDQAILNWKNGQAEAALSQLEALREKMPRNRIVIQSTLEILLAEKQYAAARQVFESFFANRQIKPHEHELLGDIYFGLGQWQKAVKAYDAYLYYNYEDFSVVNKKVEALLEMNANEQALTDAAISLRLAPEHNFQGWLNYGRLQLRERNFSEAQHYLSKAVAYNDHSPNAHLHLAFYYEAIHEASLAKKHFQCAKALGTDYHGIDFKV